MALSVTTLAQPLAYPKTEKGLVSDIYFGTTVADPFRWLEDDKSAETARWVEAQNKTTQKALAPIPYRNELRNRLTSVWNHEKISAPFIEGDYQYFYYNSGLQNQSVLIQTKAGYSGKFDPIATPFLDPNKFSKDGTTSLAGIEFSPDGSLAAYQLSEGGSDWRKVLVIRTENSALPVGDTLKDVKFSGLAWKGQSGFYYSSYDKPKSGSALSRKTSEHKLYFHKLGTPQSQDELIFGGSETPRRYIGASVTENGRFLVVTAAVSTTGNELYIQDLTAKGSKLTPVIIGFDFDNGIVHADDQWVYFYTTKDAPNGKLVVCPTDNLTSEAWMDAITQREYPITISTGAGHFFVNGLKDALSVVDKLRLDGPGLISEEQLPLPGLGTITAPSGKWNAGVLYFNFTNAIQPSTIYTLEPRSNRVELYRQSAIDFDPSLYETRQVFYTSKDGTRIPMMITHKKGLKYNKKNPTILYGYGGFGVNLTPAFSTSYVVWLENGGVLAIPNLRGGGEYGEAWHIAGTQRQKQNVFDDFIAAAEYLFAQKITSSKYLALSGGSNGGLLVGAVMTQRPELAKVAFPAVGVLDMLRYHTFTAGAGWAYDYGTAEQSQEMFTYLLGYSPVHNVRKGTCYPATMVTTADHDDRVVPAHSFKFAAELQDKQGCSAPVVIRVETKAGHGAGKPTAMVIEEAIDKFSFAFWHMGIKKLPKK